MNITCETCRLWTRDGIQHWGECPLSEDPLPVLTYEDETCEYHESEGDNEQEEETQ